MPEWETQPANHYLPRQHTATVNLLDLAQRPRPETVDDLKPQLAQVCGAAQEA
jgi:hypothetical protein